MGFLKTTEQLTFYHRPCTNRPIDQTDHRPIRNLRTRNTITNFKWFSIKGATKLCFKHYLCVVIILFNKGLYKPGFSTDSFGKLVFSVSVLFVSCQIRYKLHKLYNIDMIMVYIVGVRYTFILTISKRRSRHKHLNTNTCEDNF